MATNFLGLDLPVVSSTLGPEYATKNNEAFETLDAHDHSPGKGKQVPTSGININANLDYDSNKAYNLLSTQYASNNSTLTGSTNALSLYVTSGDLYYTNSAGTAIQITSGGSITSSPAAVQSFEPQSISGDVVIAPAASPVYFFVDTTAARNITLPLAVNVVAGRVYFVKDISGQAHTNNITLSVQGSDTIDGGASQTLTSEYGSWMAIGDGVSKWYVS